MPKQKTKPRQADILKKLRKAEAENKRLRTRAKNCICGPYTDADRERDIMELTKVINKLRANYNDEEKLKAQDRLFPSSGKDL